MDCITSPSEGGAGDDEMVPCSPHGGRTGGQEKLPQHSAPTSSLALCTIRIFFSRIAPTPPPTTIDSAWRFKGTSLRNTWQCSWDVHCGCSHAGG